MYIYTSWPSLTFFLSISVIDFVRARVFFMNLFTSQIIDFVHACVLFMNLFTKLILQ